MTLVGRRISLNDRGILTKAQVKVVEELVKEGATNDVIGAALFLTANSIKHHLTDLYQMSSTHNRCELALWWIRKGRYEQILRKAAYDRVRAERATRSPQRSSRQSANGDVLGQS